MWAVGGDLSGAFAWNTYTWPLYVAWASSKPLMREHKSPATLAQPTWTAAASQVVLVVKSPPASAGDGRDAGVIPRTEGPLERGMATHSRILAWRIPWTEEPGGL